MIPKEELERWLATLPADDDIYIDEGGLGLRSQLEPNANLEVGGEPQPDTEDAA